MCDDGLRLLTLSTRIFARRAQQRQHPHMTPYATVGCRDCEEIAMVLLDHDVEVWTQDDDTYTCPDGEDRCAHCVSRMSHPEDYDRMPRNTWTWAGPTYTADEIMTAMALADSGL